MLVVDHKADSTARAHCDLAGVLALESVGNPISANSSLRTRLAIEFGGFDGSARRVGSAIQSDAS